MQQRSVIDRVETLERKVEALETLPERVTAIALQLAAFREDVRAAFSAMRAELRVEIRTGDEQTRWTLRDEIRASNEDTVKLLRAEIRAGDEETRRYMRVLHEDVVGKIAALAEGLPARTKRR